MHNDPLIKLEDIEIPVVDEYKFIGGYIRQEINIHRPHEISKKRSTRAQQLLWGVIHTE